MKRLLLILLLFPMLSWSQVKEFDQLEMYYSQGHYKMVYKKAIHLLDNPEYDYSLLPTYYKSIALFQLYKDEKFRKRNPVALEEATTLFLKVKNEDQGGKLFSAHYYEIQSLKRDEQAFLELMKQQGKEDLYKKVNPIYAKVFQHVEVEEDTISKEAVVIENKTNIPEDRVAMINFAEKYLGTPYKYSGTDEKGFDCSGFTSFVLKNFGKDIPRTARDQFDSANKVKLKDTQPGDLVFFDSGSGINHVGIVVSNDNGNIQMIHSSTSSGVIITDIPSSAYWNKRLKASGSYLKN